MKNLSSITIRNSGDIMVPIDCVIVSWGTVIRKEGEPIWTDKTTGMCMFKNDPRDIEYYHPVPDTIDTFIKVVMSVENLRSIVKQCDELSKIEFEDCFD